jgi:formate dehydrogenase accessory protein FdhE
VAETFLRRWFGKKPSAPAADAARAEIDRLLPDRPATRGPLLWLREILDDLVPDPWYAVSLLRAPETVREECQAGRPLLLHSTLVVDADFSGRWQHICAALEQRQPGAVPAGLADVARQDWFDASALAHGLVNSGPEAVRRAAARAGADPGLFGTVLRFALFRGFAALEAEVALVRQGMPWDRGYCPTCGCPPLLAEFRGLEQMRFLRCGLCAASWEAPRQWCPVCGTRDYEDLGFLAKEGEEARYRVATCDACRTGIKTLSTLSALSPLMLLVADAATLHLDLAAADRGYQPAAGSTSPGVNLEGSSSE